MTDDGRMNDKQRAESFLEDKLVKEGLQAFTKIDLRSSIVSAVCNVMEYGSEDMETAVKQTLSGPLLELLKGLAESDLGGGKPTRTTTVADTDRASMQQLASYATALPTVVKAREELLGQREPLTRSKAADWLRSRLNGDPMCRVSIELMFSIPESEASEVPTKLRYEGEFQDSLRQLEKLSEEVAKPTTPSTLRVTVDPQFVPAQIGDKWIPLRACPGGLDSLFLWAREVVWQIWGREDVARAIAVELADAIWLILAGTWRRRLAQATFQLSRTFEFPDTRPDAAYPSPFFSIDVLDVGTTKLEVGELLSRAKKKVGLGKTGNRFDRVDEALAFVALEVKEIEGIARGERGFYEGVKKRLKVRAKAFDVDISKIKTTEAVRKRLERLERCYAEQIWATERWPRRLPVPSLFRRDGSISSKGTEASKKQEEDLRTALIVLQHYFREVDTK
jgi:hypothetical protein